MPDIFPPDHRILTCPRNVRNSQNPKLTIVLGDNKSNRGCPTEVTSLRDTTILSMYVGIPPYIIKRPGEKELFGYVER